MRTLRFSALALALTVIVQTPAAIADTETRALKTIIQEALFGETLTHGDLEAALRLAADPRFSQDLREEIADAFGTYTIFPQSWAHLHDAAQAHLQSRFTEVITQSPFLGQQRDRVRLLLDLLVVPQTRWETRSTPPHEAYQKALQEMRSLPDYEGNERYYLEEFKRRYTLHLLRESAERRRRRVPLSLSRDDLIRRLRELRLSLVQESLIHFYDPHELALYRQDTMFLGMTEDADGTQSRVVEDHFRRIRVFNGRSDILAAGLTTDAKGRLVSPDGHFLSIAAVPPDVFTSTDGALSEILTFTLESHATVGQFRKRADPSALHDVKFLEASVVHAMIQDLGLVIGVLTDSPDVDSQRVLMGYRERVRSLYPNEAARHFYNRMGSAARYYLIGLGQHPEYWSRRDRAAQALGLPSLADLIAQTVTRPTGVPLSYRIESALQALSRFQNPYENWNWQRDPVPAPGPITHPTRSRGATPPTIHSLRQVEQLERIRLYRYEGPLWLWASRIAFEIPEMADFHHGDLRRWHPSDVKPDVFLTTIEPVPDLDGILKLPAPLDKELARLEIYSGQGGSALQEGRDYEVHTDVRTGSHFVVLREPWLNQAFQIRTGFAWRKPRWMGSNRPTFGGLPADAVLAVADQLRRHELTRIADDLSRFAERARRSREGLMAPRFLDLALNAHALYSYDAQRQLRPMADGESLFAPYTGLLNERGLLCVQCGPWSHLAADIVNESFQNRPEVRAEVRGSIIRTPFRSVITAAHSHATAHVFVSGRRAHRFDIGALRRDRSAFGPRRTNVVEPLPQAFAPNELTAEADRRKLAALSDQLQRIAKAYKDLLEQSDVRAFLRSMSDLTQPMARILKLKSDLYSVLEDADTSVDQKLSKMRQLATEAEQSRAVLQHAMTLWRHSPAERLPDVYGNDEILWRAQELVQEVRALAQVLDEGDLDRWSEFDVQPHCQSLMTKSNP